MQQHKTALGLISKQCLHCDLVKVSNTRDYTKSIGKGTTQSSSWCQQH